jgi:hypothetical protein
MKMAAKMTNPGQSCEPVTEENLEPYLAFAADQMEHWKSCFGIMQLLVLLLRRRSDRTTNIIFVHSRKRAYALNN